MNGWTVFIDRDGTLNVDQVHNVDVARLTLRPGAQEALALWNAQGWRVVVVTNNSGIARGKYTEPDMHAFHAALEAGLGGRIDAFYFCPHMPDAGCGCRKPETGMFDAAISDLGIDPRRSFMIGDTAADMEAGRRIGARSIYVAAKEGAPAPPADHVARDLREAAEWTLQEARAWTS
ncbi:MAG TPA: HAD family hydrolase [Candidatus Thermoplasmatota archaeon]|nr:HAD family hydrolase [Candidatus Thermoplasmatota archaeon]